MKNFTKTLIVAFLISILIHFMMYFTIDKTLQNKKLRMNTSNKKSTLTKSGLVKIKYVKIKKVKKEKPKIKPTLKKSITKEVIRKIRKKSETKKKVKKLIPLINLPVIQKAPLDLKKFFTIQKKEKVERENEQKRVEERRKEIQEIEQLPEITQSYIKLYGEQYFEFSKYQKKYLKQNLNKIGQITQRYLKYPRISIRTKQKGLNVVEFYLHPNGDISELKLADSSFYTALDTNSMETIRIAYQDYPRPFEKVKIKIYVRYILY
jgi:protein TonB